MLLGEIQAEIKRGNRFQTRVVIHAQDVCVDEKHGLKIETKVLSTCCMCPVRKELDEACNPETPQNDWPHLRGSLAGIHTWVYFQRVIK